MNIRISNLKCFGLSIAACCAAVSAQRAAADAVTDWNANIGEVAKAACISPAASPFHESRLYAMVHLAIQQADAAGNAATWFEHVSDADYARPKG